MTDEAIRTFVAKVAAAIDADTIDSREDTTLNWMPMPVDDEGWREPPRSSTRRGAISNRSPSRAGRGSRRGRRIPVVTAMAAFESPSR